MPYVRLTIAHPRPGQERRVRELIERLNELTGAIEGCMATYVLHPHDESGDIARMAFWADEDTAEAAAADDRVLAVRSELHLALEEGHIERAFFTDDVG